MAGIDVSKVNLYSVLQPPAGVAVAKANVYAILQPPAGVAIVKALVYAVLESTDFIRSDSISLSDAADYTLTYPTYEDTLVLDDEIAVLITNLKKKALERLISVNDILSIADNLLSAAPYVTEVSDSNSISDNLIPTLARLSNFSDAISLSDDAFPLSSLFDGISLSDSAAYSLDAIPPTNYDFSFSDALAIGETQTFIASPSFISLSDNLILSDKVTGYPQTNLKNYLRRYLNDVPTPIN